MILTKAENFLQKKNIIFYVFLFLILFQIGYSFVFTGSDIFSESWKTVEELNLYKGYSYDSFDSSILAKVYFLIADHNISSDAGAQMLLAHDFPEHYFRGKLAFLNRPLYAFSVFLISRPLHFISNSYSLTFLAGIFFNFVLFFTAVFLFYILLKKLISFRVAFISSILLIFSPIVHIWLVQPETEIFGLFFVIFTLYLLYNYIESSSSKKLIIFSLIIGVLMLGKIIPALTFFILILALYFKRWKQGLLFFVIHLLPFALWYLWANKVWGLSYYTSEVVVFNMFLINNWILNVFQVPWSETFLIVLNSLPSFIYSLIYGFLLIPIIFAILGFRDVYLPRKRIFIFGFIFSFFALFFLMNYYTPRHGFLVFPVIYPLAVLGIDKTARFLKRYKSWHGCLFYLLIYGLLIIISSINIFKVFNYGVGSPWLI